MKADVDSRPGALAARQSQKEATRQRVIAAARELFDTHGYDRTTIREIARYAGVAVGSVFTTFSSKGEILSEVMTARLDRLYAELDRVMPHVRGSTADRLRTMFAVHFEFEAQHVRLFMAHIAAAFDVTVSPTARPYGRNPRLRGVIMETLERGVAEGDVRSDVDLLEVIALLSAAYAWTYRLVNTEGADTKALIAAMDRQIGLIAESFAPRD
jgi:AcrR family transcriptional regulator